MREQPGDHGARQPDDDDGEPAADGRCPLPGCAANATDAVTRSSYASPMKPTRYEIILGGHPYAAASRAARRAQPVYSAREAAIRDVAAGVAGPALIGYVNWLLREARSRGLERLRFLSRDGQVLYELARRVAPDHDLEYVYGSRMTWSLATSDADHLSSAEWLFISFIKSNAIDVCARLGIPYTDFRDALVESGVSLKPSVRADDPTQLAALKRFVDRPDVADAVRPRIARMRRLVRDYAAQHQLDAATTGLVDSGWTGRMVSSLVKVCEAEGGQRPHVLLWGHEPRATGWTDPDRVTAFVYNTVSGEGLQWRVPDAPFIVETFCMADHGIVAGYEPRPDGRVGAVLQSEANADAENWGIDRYRATLYAFCDTLEPGDGDVRPLIHDVMKAFWLYPTKAEAQAWGSYNYDTDPAGTAAGTLARPFTRSDALTGLARRHLDRGGRAWLPGSAATSKPLARLAYKFFTPAAERIGAPGTTG